MLAGPLASMLLGDLGADVVKVERPDGGDDTRAWGPPYRDGEATYYLGLNRNKRSLALDLGDAADVELARRLAAAGRRPDRVLPPRADGALGPRRRHAPRAQPAARHLLDHRLRDRGRGGAEPARLRLPAPGDGRPDERHRRGGRPAAEGRRRGRRPRLRAQRGDRDPGRAGRAGADRPRTPRRGLADGRVADGAAQPGLGLGARRGRPAPPRQPPPEHHAVRDLRLRGPADRRRGRQRPALRPPVRGARPARAAGRRALRHATARASPTPTR